MCLSSKQTVMSEANYSFLQSLVVHIPDVHINDDDNDVTSQQQQRPHDPVGSRPSDLTRSRPRDVSRSRPRGRLVTHQWS